MAWHLRGLLPLFLVFGSGVSVTASGPKAPENLLANANLRSLMRREEPETERTAKREDNEQYDLERTQWWGHHAVLPNTYRHDEDHRREELLSQQRSVTTDEVGLAQQHRIGKRSEIDRLATSISKLKAGEINKIKEILAIAQQEEVGQKQEQQLHQLQSESDLQQGAGQAHSARQFPGGLGHLVNTPGIGDDANTNSNDNAEDRFHHMTYESSHSNSGAGISHSSKEQDSSDASDASDGGGNSDPANDSKAADSSDTGGTDGNEKETRHRGNPDERDSGLPGGDDGSSASEDPQTVQERRADEERGLGPRDAGSPQTPGPEGFDSDGTNGVAEGDDGEAREADPSGASFLEIDVRGKQPRPMAVRIAAAHAAAASATDMGFYADAAADDAEQGAADATADVTAYSVSGDSVSTVPGTTALGAGTEGGDGADFQERQEPAQRERIQYITNRDGETIFPER